MQSFVQLQLFGIYGCRNIEEVIFIEGLAEEGMMSQIFPKLGYLQIIDLPKLVRFCHGSYFEFPLLRELTINNCPALKTFISDSTVTNHTHVCQNAKGNNSNIDFAPLFSEKVAFPQLEKLRIREANCRKIWPDQLVTFPNLEELKLEWNNIMKKIWHGQLRANFFYKLKVLEFIHFPDKSAVFPHCFFQSLPNLEKLVVSEASFGHIFHFEGFDGEKNHASAITSLNELVLSELPELTHLWKEEYQPIPAFCELRTLQVRDCGKLKILAPSSVSFENLTSLEVTRCHGYVNLIACSTAKSLVQLTRMTITDCEMIERIIARESEEVKGDIVFTELKDLQQSCLPNMASFCLGDHNLEFPIFEKMIVKGCPKMKIFCQRDLSIPQLQEVIWPKDEDEEKGWWEGDLKTTITRMFEKKVGYHGLEHIILSESSKLMEIWRSDPQGTIGFKSLTLIEVYDCSSLRCLFTLSMALELAQLCEIKVKNCIVMEHTITDNGPNEEVSNKIVFPLLSSITLESCEDLPSFYQGSKILECPSLEKVVASNCRQMFAFASTFSREQRIEMIDDINGGNTTRLAKGTAHTAFFNNTVVCPNLEIVKLSSIDVQMIWDDQLLEMPSYVQNLRLLIVKGCRNIEEIIFIEGLAEEGVMSQLFLKLDILELHDLPKLMRFCRGSYFEFPLLGTLVIENCPALKTFISNSTLTNYTHICQTVEGNNLDIDLAPLFSEKVAFPQLEELQIISMANCRKIWPDQLVGDSFCKLNHLKVLRCNRLLNIFPLSMKARLQNLDEFHVTHCYSLEEIFEPEVLNASELHAVTATQSIVEETTTNIVFPKQTYLELRMLPRLRSFYSRIDTTEWPSLKKMQIYGCDKVEIFALENILGFGESTNWQPLFWVNGVTFRNLEELTLECNGIMKKIWHGQLRTECDEGKRCNHTFGLPSLAEVIVSKCPEMEIFCKRVLNAPMLQRVQETAEDDKGHWDGDLNSIVQRLYVEKVGY
ncbi:PREDICTED: uncharacterized protein LOC108662044 [Theobroma cacao]|uniref:Uncharacterized protein LOC108662044 n=1 Tax=Theobroma cacao TaxID=3641 RepID=A0AB32WCG3_THECC|nr:PREDICTED: uncharacterized protein LOC108662044 [Theobroma cacao]